MDWKAEGNEDGWRFYLQSILGNLPVGVVVTDRDLVIQAFNPAAERLTGVEAAKAIGEPYAEVLRTRECAIADPLEEALATGETFVNQRFYLRPHEDAQDALPIRHSAAVLTREDGTVVGGVTIFADISRQVRLERELREQRRYLADVLRSIPDGVVTTDSDLVVHNWNEAAARITGLPRAEAVGRPCDEVLAPLVCQALRTLLFEEGTISRSEQRTHLTLPNGDALPIGFNVGDIRTAGDDEVAGGVVVLRDIRRRLARRRQLLNQQHYLSEVLSLAPYGIFTVNSELRIRTFNQAAGRLTGYAASYAIGKPYAEVVHLDVEEGRDPVADLFTESRGTFDERLWLTDVGGKRLPVQCSAAPLTDADDEVTGAIVIFQDVSDIVAAERTKNEFVSMVSHELRTPLTSIKGFVTALLDGRAGELNERQERFLTISQEQSNLLLALINDLLDLTRLESGKIEVSNNRVSVPELLEETVQSLQPLIRAKDLRVQIAVEGAEGLPFLWADEKRVRQVLQNLLSNAVKFTPAEGEIRLTARRRGDEVVLEVADTGMGIPPEEQERIFEPFYQVENVQTRRVGGTGLGLAIVARIVEAHEGRVEVESEVGKGATFRVYLPLAKTPVTAVRERAAVERELLRDVSAVEKEVAPVPSPAARSEERANPLILVVDDDPATNLFIKFILEEEGYDVVSAYSAPEALELASQEVPDVITLDLLMPKMDGFHMLSLLKQDPRVANVPVCIVSIIEERAQGYRLGAIDYITKPFESEDLLHAIAGILEPSKDGDRLRVLVVEDDPHVLELVELALPPEDFDVITATDGVVGLEHLHHDHPDLVLLDIMVPRLDGYDFIRRAKANPRTEGIPILVLSVRSLEEDINYALKLGAEKYLVKASGEMARDLTDVVGRVVHEVLDEPVRTGEGEPMAEDTSDSGEIEGANGEKGTRS